MNCRPWQCCEGEGEASVKDETSVRSLLVELDSMEQGLKIDFDDLLQDPAPTDDDR